MRIAYADPPYPGDAWRYGRREVNHARLVAALRRFDGWALSSSSHAFAHVAPLMPEGVRVGAWVKKNGVLGNGRAAVSAWEPVFFSPARERATARGRVKDGTRTGDPILLDWICTPRFAAFRPEGNFRGAKPPEFCGWLFELLGAEPGDEFFDLFHGSGAVSRAWSQWCQVARRGGPLFAEAQEDRDGR